jgi:hypothetical protein
MSVLAAHHNPVIAEHFFGYAHYVVTGWQFDGVVAFAFDLPLAHGTTSTLSFQ